MAKATKFKSHKGLLKRVKITARKKVKFFGAGASHLMSGTKGRKCQDLRKAKYAKRGDARRLQRLLNVRVTPIDVARKLARQAEEAAAAAAATAAATPKA